jgi:hypothetical protein
MTCAEVTASGVDTVSYAFRPEGPALFAAVDGFRARPHRGGPSGALVADERGTDGGRRLIWPRVGVLALETRLGALLAGDQANHDLAPAQKLAVGARNARLDLWELVGVDPGPATEVRRYDLAAELRFSAGSDGIAFLRTVAGLIPARARGTVEVNADGSVMTAYARTAKRGVVHARIYDKGRESGSDPPGERVRIESQNRPAKARRYSPEVLATLDLKGTFGRTMNPYLNADELVVAGADGAVAELAARAIRGELSHAKAERLIGSVALLKHGGRAVYDRDDSTRVRNNERSSRRLKALRDEGLVLADELPASSLVPVSELLRDAVSRFSA